MQHHRRPTAVVVAIALFAALLLGVSPVLAASQTQSTSLTFSGSSSPSITYTATNACDICIPDYADAFIGGTGSFAFGASAVTTVNHLDWTNTAAVDVKYDDALLRQGQTLALSDVLTPGVGHIHASGTIGGSYGIYNDASGGTTFIPYGSQKSISQAASWDFSCTIPLPGESPRPCSSGSQTFDIDSYTIFVVPFVDPISINIDFKVAISLDLTVSSSGVPTVRQIEVTGGGGPQSAPLTWLGSAPSSVADTAHLSCAEPAGNPVAYRFTNSSYSPTDSLASTTALVAKVVASPAVGPDVTLFSLGTFGSATSPGADVSFEMDAPAAAVTLGTLAKNTVPPIVDPGGDATATYTGVEGSPVTFDGSASHSVCGFPTLRWDFSDGGVAFGKNPQHAFQGPGLYSGLLTATDATGLTSSATFAINVTNLPPVVTAGPDTTAAWGRLVAFNGSAVDPGANDQATLSYSWAFGDGTPSATGGPSASHAYSTPGTYTATFTACDQWGACSVPASRTVHVRARNTTLGYLGDHGGTYNTTASFSASLVDEFNQAVPGRTVSLTVGTETEGSPSSNSSGLATTSHVIALPAGSYTASANFAGDSLYNAAGPSTASFTVVQKGTTLTYTGALSGGPNKTVTLSAKLVDATGTALGGRTIAFKLGAQSASATTDSTGVASTNLKLAQKNGTYTVTATYGPSGGDAVLYLGSATSATFKLQAK